MNNPAWDAIPAEEPDEQDRQMLTEIEANPECQEFVSADEAMRMLGMRKDSHKWKINSIF